MDGVVPDSFFLLCIKAGGAPAINCGPYTSFGAAAEVSMESVHIALAINGVTPVPGALVQTKVLECLLIDGQVSVLSERASDVGTIH